MGGICKEGWLWGLLIKFFFGLHQNLTSGTFVWMLEHSLYCAVITADKDINNKEAIIECILYHLIIAEASKCFELPSELLGHSCYSASSPLFSAESHLQQALE